MRCGPFFCSRDIGCVLGTGPFFCWTHRRTCSEAFRTQIVATKMVDRCPVKQVGSVSFMFIQCDNVYVVAVARQNVNVTAVLEVLHRSSASLPFSLYLACFIARMTVFLVSLRECPYMWNDVFLLASSRQNLQVVLWRHFQ